MFSGNMEDYIRYCEKVLPKQAWFENELNADKVLKWFNNYKYSSVYLWGNAIIADIHMFYTNEDKYDADDLLKISGSKAYRRLEDYSSKYWDDIKQTTANCGMSVGDPAKSSSPRTNIFFMYTSFIVTVSSPAGYADLIAHKILMNLIVSPYRHQSLLNVEKMIDEYEISHLIDPVLCECCNRPSEKIIKRLPVCTGCMCARYCDRDCQKKDWKKHKLICSKKV